MAEQALEGERQQFVIFRLHDSEFGVDVQQVLRIVRPTEITRVPRAPAFLEGVANVHGEIVPVVDLKKRFELSDGEYDDQARIIIVQVKDQMVGMLVDSVREITWLPRADIEPPPELVADIRGVYLTGLGRLDDRLIILLDLSQVLTTKEVEELEQMDEGGTEQG